MQQEIRKPIIIGHYLQKEQIGRGSQGEVYQMINMMNNKVYAAKIFDKKSNKLNTKSLRNEIGILLQCMKCRNENIVQFIEFIQTETKYILIFEKCDNDLRIVIEQGLNEQQALEYLKQIVNGISQLHKIKINHRDLKPGNILIKDNIIKIADLGLGCLNDMSGLMHFTQAFGTLGYMAPEVLEQRDHDPKIADMYSLGIILRELLYQRRSTILSSDSQFQYTDQISLEVNELIKKMTNRIPEQRLRWTELTTFLENKFRPMNQEIYNSIHYLEEGDDKVKFFLELYEKISSIDHGERINPFSPVYMILKVVYLELKQRERELTNIPEELSTRIILIKEAYEICYMNNRKSKFDRVYNVVMAEELENQYIDTNNFNKNLKFILRVYFQQLQCIDQTPVILKIQCALLIAINYGFTKLQEIIYGEIRHNSHQDILADMIKMAENKDLDLKQIEKELD